MRTGQKDKEKEPDARFGMSLTLRPTLHKFLVQVHASQHKEQGLAEMGTTHPSPTIHFLHGTRISPGFIDACGFLGPFPSYT